MPNSATVARRALFAASLSAAAAHALQNGVARVPPLGWSSWNAFECNVDETKIKQVADAMVSSGMKDAGYQYVNLDDCWEGPSRDGQGRLTGNSNFPSGMKALADYVHSKGLKFGIYSSAGNKTCGGYLGSNGHEDVDAQTFADWGVDFLKYDGCNDGDYAASMAKMRDALLAVQKATGRGIVYSTALNGPSAEGGDGVVHMARHTGDLEDKWPQILDHAGQQSGMEYTTKPGFWNDPDMLVVGSNHGGTLTDVQAQSHFTLWCVFAAPLLAGNDIRSMSPAIKAILTNTEAIAVDQDSLGIGGQRVWVSPDTLQQVWMKPLKDGSRAVVLFNGAGSDASITCDWKAIGWPQDLSAQARDLLAHADKGAAQGHYTAQVPAYGSAFLRLTPSADHAAPKVQYILADEAKPGLVQVYFDERVERSTAQNPANYSLDHGATVLAAKLDSQAVQTDILKWPELRKVTLQVSPLQKGQDYQLTVRNVRDRSPAANAMAASSYGFRAQARLSAAAGGNCAQDQAKKMVDGDTTDNSYGTCGGTDASPGSLSLDFGSAKRVKAITYWEREIIYISSWAQAMAWARVQGSNDGNQWADLAGVRRSPDFDTAAAIDTDWRRRYFAPTTLFLPADAPAYRYLRILGHNKVELQELAAYEDAGPLSVSARPAAPARATGATLDPRPAPGGDWDVKVAAAGGYRLLWTDGNGRVLAAIPGAGVGVHRLHGGAGAGLTFLRLEGAGGAVTRLLPPR